MPELAGQTILVNGVAKTYAMTGWRVGWMVGPKDAIKVAANLQSHLSSNVNNIAQRAALAALTGPQAEAEQFRQAFDRRRRLIVGELSKIDGVAVPNPLGAFYVYPDVQGLLGREWRGKTPTTSLELADLILEEAEVAVVPGEAFGPSGYLRLSYALGDDALLEGVQPPAAALRLSARIGPATENRSRRADSRSPEPILGASPLPRAAPAPTARPAEAGRSARQSSTPTSTGSGCSTSPNSDCTRPWMKRASSASSSAVALSAVGQREGVLRRQRGARARQLEALAEAGVLDEPGGADLHVARDRRRRRRPRRRMPPAE